MGAAYMKSLSEGRLKLADCLHLPHRRSNPAYNPDWEASWKNKVRGCRPLRLSTPAHSCPSGWVQLLGGCASISPSTHSQAAQGLPLAAPQGVMVLSTALQRC